MVADDFFQGRLVLVTGGTGFIGQRLVSVLRERRVQLRVLVRAINTLPADWDGIETAVGDLTDSASLEQACYGVNTVLHIAGFAHADATNAAAFTAQHWEINAEGTFRLLAAAVNARVERFVFVSSVKAVGTPGSHCVDERWDLPPETPYGQAKRAAEERVALVGLTQKMHVVNLRPALVYGPGMRANLLRLVEGVRRGWLPPLPETSNRRSLVHVDDLVQAILLCASHPVAAGKTYFVTDGVGYSGRDLYVMICSAMGRSIPHWSVPAGLLWRAAAVTDQLLAWRGNQDRKAYAAVEKLLGWACYDSTQISTELGYTPIWTFDKYCKLLKF